MLLAILYNFNNHSLTVAVTTSTLFWDENLDPTINFSMLPKSTFTPQFTLALPTPTNYKGVLTVHFFCKKKNCLFLSWWNNGGRSWWHIIQWWWRGEDEYVKRKEWERGMKENWVVVISHLIFKIKWLITITIIILNQGR